MKTQLCKVEIPMEKVTSKEEEVNNFKNALITNLNLKEHEFTIESNEDNDLFIIKAFSEFRLGI